MSDALIAALAIRQDLLACKLDTLATTMGILIEELQRENEIQDRTLKAWGAAMRERGDGGDWWKGDEG